MEFRGSKELQAALMKNAKMETVRRVVRQNGAELQQKAQREASFKGHYEGTRFVSPTGTTKRSIRLEMSDLGMTATVEPETEYSPYLEHGTRFMEAQPFVGPAFNQQKEQFKKDLDKLVK